MWKAYKKIHFNPTAEQKAKVEEEIKRLSQKITGKITLLSEYYESPLKEQELELEKLEEKVNQHLKVMGF
jgi:C4-type Zn-finger protein